MELRAQREPVRAGFDSRPCRLEVVAMSSVCKSCETLYVNGRLCHERGCPDAWKDVRRECRNCGGAFRPTEARQQFCDESCAVEFYGLPSWAC